MRRSATLRWLVFALMVCASPTIAAEQTAANDQMPKAQAGERLDYRLPIPAGGSDPETFIPVSVLEGTKPGPKLLVTAGVHGYEFAPILALQELAEKIDPQQLTGSLTLVKLAHVSAFEARSPYVNPFDRKNLNRAFPGDPDGTQTERIAWALSEELIAEADFVIDVHSGDGAEWLEAFAGVYGGKLASRYEQALAVAEAFGFPNLVCYRMERQEQVDRGRSLNRQAVAAGAPTLLVEIGENGGRDPSAVAAIVDGLTNALATLGMLPPRDQAASKATATRTFDGTSSVPVKHSGIWTPAQRTGRVIEQGEILGTLTGYDGSLLETVRAPSSGYAIYGLAGPPVRAGESVMTIAKPVDSLR